jgi:amino acid adenylation domain-containing protein
MSTTPDSPDGEPGRPRPARSEGIPPAPSGASPASSAQRRLWFLDRLLPRPEAYHVPTLVRWEGGVDPAVLRRCLAEIMARHEPLRTAFGEVDGELRQFVAGAPAVPLEERDLRAVPQPARDADAAALIAEQAARPFDLSRAPLWRAALIRLTDDVTLMPLTLHHIAVDAWSIPALFDEIAQLYAAFADDRPSPLRPLPVRYVDYAAWQQERLAGPRTRELLDHWRSVLADAPRTTDLPTDRPRPAVFSHDGDAVEFTVPDQVTRQIGDLARRLRTTPFVVLLSAFAAMLHRYVRRPDVVIGTPAANRAHPDVADLIGFFTNMLVLPVDLTGRPSFAALVARVRALTLTALDHQDLPFEHLVAELDPERSLSYNPLFQVQFALASVPKTWTVRPGLRIVWLPGTRTRTAKFDLSFVCYEESGRLRGGAEYAVDLFDRATVERMVEHFRTLLRAATTRPDVPVEELDLTDEQELRTVAAASIGPARPGADPAVISEMFAEQVARTPDAPALRAADVELSYAELNRRANRLAWRLRARGVGPDVPVAICLERSAALLEAVLAVLKAGGAYVPVDPRFPAYRRDLMLADSRPAVYVTQRTLLDDTARHAGHTLLVDEPAGTDAQSDADPPTVAHPENLAYVTFTSGSTGRPKGVAVPHRVVVNLMRWYLAGPAAGRPTLQFATLSFDVSIYEILGAWLSGATLVLAGDTERHDVGALAGLLADRRVGTAMPPVPVLHRLAATLIARPATVGLTDVVTIGEPLVVTPAVRELFRRLPGARLHNQYGPSETGTVVTDHTLSGDPQQWPDRPPIGRPIPGARVYVLDADLRRTPIGVPGEVYIGGESVSRGYLGRPGLTADRFVPDGCGDRPGQRLYRTGDLARIGPDGRISFIGRVDHQLKVRGLRVELGEIEAMLCRHPGVRAGVVVARPAGAADQRLAAYAVGDDLRGETLRAYLKQRLPAQMVPATVAILGELPLTASGKVDRAALPEPQDAEAYAAPATATERVLAGIWSAVLGRERVGRHDDFFAVGGHSLLAAQVITHVRATFSVDLTFVALFEHPTITELATHIDASGNGAPAAAGTIPRAVRRSAPAGPVPAAANVDSGRRLRRKP